jgi:hypothetical protein
MAAAAPPTSSSPNQSNSGYNPNAKPFVFERSIIYYTDETYTIKIPTNMDTITNIITTKKILTELNIDQSNLDLII